MQSPIDFQSHIYVLKRLKWNVEEFLFLDKILKIQESLCTLVVSGSLSIQFLFTTSFVQWNGCLAFRWGNCCWAQLHPCPEKVMNCIVFELPLHIWYTFSPKTFSSGQKDINLFKINYIFRSTFFCDRRVSAMPIDANTLDSLWCWNSSLLSTPAFCSAVGFCLPRTLLFMTHKAYPLPQILGIPNITEKSPYAKRRNSLKLIFHQNFSVGFYHQALL